MPASLHRIAPVFSDRRRRKIGILGGSFNPAHSGHSHIADEAIKHLHLDELWWLVTPQNPLKPQEGMAPFVKRMASALDQAKKSRFAKRMLVSPLEDQFKLQHSAMTLKMVSNRAPMARFVWIMGADNLAGFHLWHRPQVIAHTMAIAVINRPNKRPQALGSRGVKIAGKRLTPRQLSARGLPPKHWCFVNGELNHQSATALRANRAKKRSS